MRAHGASPPPPVSSSAGSCPAPGAHPAACTSPECVPETVHMTALAHLVITTLEGFSDTCGPTPRRDDTSTDRTSFAE